MEKPDPRDACILMLVERVGVLEEKVHELQTAVNQLQKKIMEFELQPFLPHSSMIINDTEMIYVMTLHILANFPENMQQLKQDCEHIVKHAAHALGGSDTIRTATVVIPINQPNPIISADLVLNFRQACWRHEASRILSHCPFPRKVFVNDTNRIFCQFTYTRQNCEGIYLPLFDTKGQATQQQWTQWKDTIVLAED